MQRITLLSRYAPVLPFTLCNSPFHQQATSTFKIEHRSLKLKQFLRKYDIYSCFTPSFLNQCGKASPIVRQSVEGYRYLMRECTNNKKPQLAIHLYEECKQSLLAYHPRIVKELYRAYVQTKNTEKLLEHFEQVMKMQHYNEELIEQLIDALTQLGILKEAFILLNRVKNHFNETPSVYMYNSLLAKVDIKMGKTLFKELIDTTDPNIDTFNALIVLFGNAKRYESIYSSVEKLEDHNIIPNTKTIETLLIYAIEQGGTHSIDYAMQKMRQYDIQPNAFIIEKIVYGFGNLGEVERARDFFYSTMDFQVKRKNEYTLIKPATYLALAQGYFVKEDVDECLELISEMKEARVYTEELRTLYSKTIKICCKHDALRAFTIFQRMKNDMFNPSAEDFNEIIFTISEDLSTIMYSDKVTALYCEVRALGYTIQSRTYYRLLTVFLKTQNWEAVSEVVRDMVHNELSIPVNAYKQLMDATADKIDPALRKEVKEAFAKFPQQKEGSSPNN